MRRAAPGLVMMDVREETGEEGLVWQIGEPGKTLALATVRDARD